jgi:hypothetical protein
MSENCQLINVHSTLYDEDNLTRQFIYYSIKLSSSSDIFVVEMKKIIAVLIFLLQYFIHNMSLTIHPNK